MARTSHAPAVRCALIAAIAIALIAAVGVPSPAFGAPKVQPVKVMTLNAYVGSDLRAVLDARSVPELFAGATEVYRQVQANDFPSRAHALAAMIGDADPMVIGVQEASKWLTGEPGVLDGPPTPAQNVAYDYLDLLLDALADAGTPYQAYETRIEFDGEVRRHSASMYAWCSETRFSSGLMCRHRNSPWWIRPVPTSSRTSPSSWAA